MADKSEVGLLVYRILSGPELLLVRAGGPFWSKRDRGTWSIPKSPAGAGDLLALARLQFIEDTGLAVDGEFVPLEPLDQKGGTHLQTFAVACDVDLAGFRSKTFSLEWPPGSGHWESFPEIERIQYADLPTAVRRILPPQWPLLLEAAEKLGWRMPPRARRGPERP